MNRRVTRTSKARVDNENEKQSANKKAAPNLNDKENLVERVKRHSLRKLMLAVSMIAMIYAYSYFTRPGEVFNVMAPADRFYGDSPIGQRLVCASDYDAERKTSSYSACLPKQCGRFVSDALVSQQEALELRALAEMILKQANPSGGVAIFDLNSGALSNGTQFVNYFKLTDNRETSVLRQKSLDTFVRITNKIQSMLSMSFGIPVESLHLTSPVFFSRMTTKPAKTMNDEYWHAHIDKLTYGTFHYTSLLYLSTYAQEFQGGRFIFLDPKQNITIEPRFGRVSAFSSGSENQHMVEKVTRGERHALTIPFTCNLQHKAIIRKLNPGND